MKNTKLENQVQEYINAVFPDGCTPRQYEAIQDAFMAGITQCYSTLVIEIGAMPPELAEAELETMRKALNAYADKVTKRIVRDSASDSAHNN